MKEYAIENGEVDVKKLETGWLPEEQYKHAHKGVIILCHDVIIKYNGGFLLVKRKNYPAKNSLWFIGGRVKRGISVLDSLKDLVYRECGLKLEEIEELGNARTYFETDPIGHGKGTDSVNFVFLAIGKGELILDSFHEEPTIISQRDYTEEFKKSLHPYVRDFLDKAIEKVGKSL